MYELMFINETLKREREERLQRIQRKHTASQFQGRSPFAFLLEALGNLLVAAGQRLQARAGKTPLPFEQSDLCVVR